MGDWIAFGVVAFGLLFSAAMVVRSTDLVRAVLWLAGTLITTAVAYVLLHADFLAAAQILLYTGGVVTLMLFAVMLTRRLTGARVAIAPPMGALRGALVAVAVFVLVAAAVDAPEPGSAAPAMAPDTAALGELFLTDLVFPFELLGVLLLAAMIGAIVLSRRDGQAREIPRLPRSRP